MSDILNSWVEKPQELLDFFGFNQFPYDPFAIARDIETATGIVIEINQDLSFSNANTSGSITKSVDNKMMIWISPKQDRETQRFVLAHELGHLVNDIDPDNNINEVVDRTDVTFEYTSYSFNTDADNAKLSREEQREVKANYFAAGLLMPRQQVAKEFVRFLDGNLDEHDEAKIRSALQKTANAFDVPELVMLTRLREIQEKLES